MVPVDKDYRFEGPGGEVGLIDLFEGRHQLIVCHFMFDPEWEDGCPSCTAGADEMPEGKLTHLHARDTTLAYVSRAPYAKIAAYKQRRGWTFPWYSSHGSDFNYDFHVTLDESVAPVQYNFRTPAEFAAAGQEFELAGEFPGRSSFLRDGDRVYHTYSVYARGLETMGGSYYLLDETALGPSGGLGAARRPCRLAAWRPPGLRHLDARTAARRPWPRRCCWRSWPGGCGAPARPGRGRGRRTRP